MSEPRLLVITALWQRHRLAELMLSSLRAQGIPVIAVGSEGSATAEIADRAGAAYVEYANQPVGRKWNHVLQQAEHGDCDGVVALGSDDFASPGLFAAWRRMLSEGVEYMGVIDGYVYDAPSQQLRYWPGYMGQRKGEPLGAGRCFSRSLLDRMGWRLWDDDRDRGLDGSLTVNIQSASPRRWAGSMIEIGAQCTGVKVGVGISGVPDDSVAVDVSCLDEWYGDGFIERAKGCM